MQQIVQNAYLPSLEAERERILSLPCKSVPIDRTSAIEVLRVNLNYQRSRIALVDKNKDYNLYRYLRKDIKTMESTLKQFYKVEP